jgi:hypothetical protein
MVKCMKASLPLRQGARPSAARAVMAFVAVLTPFGAASSDSPIPLALSGLALIAVVTLLWNRDEPPILLLPVLFQWSEVAIWPISTLWRQMALNDMSNYGADLDGAAAYGLAGVTALAAGLRFGSRKRTFAVSFSRRLQFETRAWKLEQVLRLGFGAMTLGYLSAALAGYAGPARELFGNAAGVKYVGIFLIVYWCLANGRNYSLVVGIVGFELLFGMTGFFADFKFSLLTLVVAVMAARPRLRGSDLAMAALVAVLVLFVGTFWSAVKNDYRQMVNQGTGAQVVSVPFMDRLEYIVDALDHVGGPELEDGFNRLISRHGYITFLALVMQNVPRTIPHENGQLTLDVIEHITMPRLFFPNKPPLPSDTVVMQHYTGLEGSGDENTSISIGNLGELYIDFGLIGGLLAEFFIGLLIATAYRALRDNAKCPAMITAGLCVMIALPIAYFGTAYAKLIGSFVFTAVIAIAAQRYALPPLLAGYRLPLALPFLPRPH